VPKARQALHSTFSTEMPKARLALHSTFSTEMKHIHMNLKLLLNSIFTRRALALK
jgi:hypothetical protein